MLKLKSEVFSKFRDWKAMVERSTGRKLKVLWSDNSGEYTSGEFAKYLKSEGICHEMTVLKSLQQNGVAEHLNRTLVEMTRSMLAGSGLPQNLWAETLSTAVYLRNRSPTKEGLHLRAFIGRSQMSGTFVYLDVCVMLILPRMSRRSWMLLLGDVFCLVMVVR